jgi:hypothetical protein
MRRSSSRLNPSEIQYVKDSYEEKRKLIEKSQDNLRGGQWADCNFLSNTPSEIVEVRLVSPKSLVGENESP